MSPVIRGNQPQSEAISGNQCWVVSMSRTPSVACALEGLVEGWEMEG